MIKKKIYKDYNELLMKRLKDPEMAMAYLNETLKDPDPKVFLMALKDVVAARGFEKTTLAKKAHFSRQTIYRILSDKGNPRWDRIVPLIDAVGLQVQLTSK